LHLVGLLFNVNYDARNHELKKRVVFILQNVQTGYGNPGIKRPGREVNDEPVSGAGVRNEWS